MNRVETLEARRLLSGVASNPEWDVSDDDNTWLGNYGTVPSGPPKAAHHWQPYSLVYNGTAGDDRIIVFEIDGVPIISVNGQERDGAYWMAINCNAGNDVVSIELSDARLERIFAGDGNDVITGGNARDSIYGEGGDDSIRGGGGSDLLDGGEGFDTVRGDAGNDNICGGASADRLRGSDGNDTLDGGGGRDLIGGEAGDDSIVGGNGYDHIDGGDGADVIDGGADPDHLRGGAGSDILRGGAGMDVLRGDEDLDQIFYIMTDADWFDHDEARTGEVKGAEWMIEDPYTVGGVIING